MAHGVYEGMSKMIHIVHVIDNLNIGGAEKQLALFARYIDQTKYKQTVLCMREAGPLEASCLSPLPLSLRP